jgi:hypothetical protein
METTEQTTKTKRKPRIIDQLRKCGGTWAAVRGGSPTGAYTYHGEIDSVKIEIRPTHQFDGKEGIPPGPMFRLFVDGNDTNFVSHDPVHLIDPSGHFWPQALRTKHKEPEHAPPDPDTGATDVSPPAGELQ